MNLSTFSPSLAVGIAAVSLAIGMLAGGGLTSIANAQNMNTGTGTGSIYGSPGTGTGTNTGGGTNTGAMGPNVSLNSGGGFYNSLGQWVALSSLFGNGTGGLFGNNGSVCSANIPIGTTGTDVSALQQRLVNSGFMPAGDVTGYFGPITQAALARACSSSGGGILSNTSGGFNGNNLGNLWAAAALFGNGYGGGANTGTSGGFYNSLGQWVALQSLFGNGGYGNGSGFNGNNLGNLWAAAALFGNGNGTVF